MNEDVDTTLHPRFSRQAEALPGPDLADVRRRARGSPRHARKSRLFNLRWDVALGLALLLGGGLGFALGAAKTPSSDAATRPLGLGFLPERGWDMLQSGTRATLGSPTVSIAANVDLHPDDDADGLPLSTLQTLPRNGIVIIASFTVRGKEPLHDAGFQARRLPLSIREGAPFGIQLRPDRPLGQYEMRAAVRNHNVHVEIYLGTAKPSRVLLTAAQRQLARLVVAPGPLKPPSIERAPATLNRLAVGRPLSPSASRVIDRTLVCRLAFGSFEAVASPRGASDILGARFTSSGYVRVSSGSPRSDPRADLIVAARPGLRSPDVRFPAAAYASSRRCVPSRAPVPLARAGLTGPPTEFLTEGDCTADGRVLVRVRAVLATPATWRRFGGAFVGARGRLLEADLAVRDQRTRTPLVFARVRRTGKTQLWTGSRCT